MAMSLKNQTTDPSSITELGSILYSKRVMGHRIVTSTTKKNKVAGI